MSRRTQAFIEEDFDDDTELALPARPLPNTGSRGALLQSIDSDEDSVSEDDDDVPHNDSGRTRAPLNAGPATPSLRDLRTGQVPGHEGAPLITDVTPYKKWTCIYPIYIDAKQPYGTGLRRIAREKAVWYPLSKDIADSASRLGLSVLHEINKTHPRDWENPGRVRVQWKKDGRLINFSIKTKKQLLERISADIQKVKAEYKPRPPFTASNTTTTTGGGGGEATSSTSVTASSTKGGNVGTSKSKQQITSGTAKVKGKGKGESNKQVQVKENRSQVPQPPEPHPPLSSRVSPYSPALSSGVLIDTIKAGMNAGAVEGPGGATPGSAGGKGKRKVIRVRG